MTAAQAQPAGPGPDRALVVTNRAGLPVTELYVSSSRTDDWGENRLGSTTLKPGASLSVRLGRGRDCGFDVLVTYRDGREEETDDVDACAVRTLSFDGSSAQPVPAADQEQQHQVTLADRTPLDIGEVYISPAAAARWGDDLLAGQAGTAGDTRVPAGGSLTLTYHGACAADLRVVFENSAAEERRNMNLCAHAIVTIAPGWTTQEDAPVAGLVLNNRTGSTIAELYAYPDGSDVRGPDLLGGKVAEAGSATTLPFDPGHACRGTIRAVLAGHHDDIVRTGVDLCATHEITFASGPDPTVAQEESREAR